MAKVNMKKAVAKKKVVKKPVKKVGASPIKKNRKEVEAFLGKADARIEMVRNGDTGHIHIAGKHDAIVSVLAVALGDNDFQHYLTHAIELHMKSEMKRVKLEMVAGQKRVKHYKK